MLCVNAPRKPMARIHLLVSLVLVIICTVLAFTPLMKVVVSQDTQDSIKDLVEYIMDKDSSEDAAARNEKVQKIIDSMNLDEASVDISIAAMTKLSKPLTDASNALTEILTAAMNSSADDAEEKAMEGVEKLKAVFFDEEDNIRPEVVDLVVVVAAIVGPMLPSGSDIESGMSEDDVPKLAAQAIPNMIALIAGVILAVIMPIIFAILALITIITALRYLKDPVVGAAKLAKRMPKAIVHPLAVIMITGISDTIVYTKVPVIMAIIALVGTAVNIVFTRLHSWERKDIRYANVVQLANLISIGAYVFLFLNILKMGIFKSFIGGVMDTAMSSTSSAASSSAASGIGADAGMLIISVLFALLSLKYLAKVLRRESLACTPKRKGGARCTHLVYALFLLLITVFPMMALGSENPILFVTVEQEYALLYGFIATAVMVVSEIALLILRKVFGKDLTPEAVADVMSGEYEGPEKVATPAEEAPAAAAEVAAAEEAPAEEAASEDKE